MNDLLSEVLEAEILTQELTGGPPPAIKDRIAE